MIEIKNTVSKKLKHDYISVITPGQAPSFGGSQMWYGRIRKELKFREKLERDNRIRSYGCGLVAASDILLYLENEKDSTPAKNRLGMEDYSKRLLELEKKYFKIYHVLGITGTRIARKLNSVFKHENLPYTAKWGTGEKDFLDCIEEMIDNNIPILFSVGPGYMHKERVKLYKINVYNNKTVFSEDTTVKDHYMTITGIVYGEEEKKVMLELSSWGKKYYLDYDEYADYVTESDNTLFSSLLYITKK